MFQLICVRYRRLECCCGHWAGFPPVGEPVILPRGGSAHKCSSHLVDSLLDARPDVGTDIVIEELPLR